MLYCLPAGDENDHEDADENPPKLEGSSESQSNQTAISLAAQLFLTHVLITEIGCKFPVHQAREQVTILLSFQCQLCQSCLELR